MTRNPQSILTDDDIREKVALRAYEIYEDRGGQHGRDIDDWLQAEDEVLAETEEKKALYGRKQPSATQSVEAPQSTRRMKKTADTAR
jgi:hypothetical protein